MHRDPAFLAECRALVRTLECYPTLAALRSSDAWPDLEPRLRRVLGAVRCQVPVAAPGPSANPDRVRAVHWNIEHGNRYEQIEAALVSNPDLVNADLYLFNEIDFGMARAANRDVAADLARALDRHGVWAPLFLETTLGRDDDPLASGGCANQESLFGIAILSRWPISDVRVVELPGPEQWHFDLERMYGRHIGLIVTIERPGAPFVAVSAHLEVHRARCHRAAQARVLLEVLRDERRPILFAGDFNTHTFDRGTPWSALEGARVLMLTPDRALRRRLQFPDRGPAREALFDMLHTANFEWNRFNDRAPTLQLRLDRLDEMRHLPRVLTAPIDGLLAWAERRAGLRLDWFAGRGWSGGTGATAMGLSGPGRASDHSPIVADFW